MDSKTSKVELPSHDHSRRSRDIGNRNKVSGRRLAWSLLLLGSAAAFSAQAQVPTFAKSFAPGTIGPGATSTLNFTIDNNELGVRDLAFTDDLPSGMTIADPANAGTSCSGASLSAPAEGGTIVFADGALPAGSSCSVSVDVTSSTSGTNISGDLTSDAGNSGPATADLTVATDRPGFSKSFSPGAVFFGGRSTLTFTIDNSANKISAVNLNFTDSLPSGMTIAGPANASTDCGGNLSAPPGGSVITYGPNFLRESSVAAGATCSISVDVVANSIGVLGNTSGELTSEPGPFGGTSRSSGKASASLSVAVEQISLIKSFTDDPVPPGGTATLEFTVQNLDRSSPATNISFTDNLEVTLSGLAAVGLPANDVCGDGSSLTGSSVISLNGGSLPAGGSCTFSVTLQVPSNTAGQFGNITSEITADIGGAPVTGGPASDDLFVEPAPLLVKTFLDDPVGAGASTELQFTITNTSPDQSATDIAFQDVFDVILPSASSVPASDFCGLGSTATYTPLVDTSFGSTPAQLAVSGASLAAGGSCSFSVVLDVATGAATGTYFNTTGAVAALVGGESFSGSPASDTLDVVAAPKLTKAFTDDPALPGGTVTLEFTLSHDENAPGEATGISFSDDLEGVLSGLAAVGLPANDVCGAGSQISGTSNLTFTGGTLAPGASCTFSVTLQVPAEPDPGSHTNTTSNVQATVLGLTTTENPASDDLQVAGLVVSKEFVADPVLPGDTVILRFTLENLSPLEAVIDIGFTDDLDATVDGLVVVAGELPVTDPCGAGSSLTGAFGDSLLVFQDGSLGPAPGPAASSSCSFEVRLQVPAATEPNGYVNTTSPVSATVNGATLTFDPATDRLDVEGDLLTLSKEFIDDPANPGGAVTLRFTLGNLSLSQTLSSIAFTDNLAAALAGLVSSAGPLTDICGVGSELTGTDLLTFIGGSLAPIGDPANPSPESSCSFDVPLSVPSDAPIGSVHTNTTSDATAQAGIRPVTAPPASDVLAINFLGFSKAFDYGPGNDSAIPGGSVNLTFTIENLSQTATAAELAFNDDLEAVLPGLVATGLPQADLCGTGSLVSGDAIVSLSDGSVAPNGSCTITVELAVPSDAVPGDYLNISTDLFQFEDRVPVAGPASDILRVVDIGDDDGDGVPNDQDLCPGTVIPEGVPTIRLGVNRFALVDGDGIFDTTLPPGRSPSGVSAVNPPGSSGTPAGSSGNPPASNGSPPGLAGLLNLLGSGGLAGSSPPSGGNPPGSGASVGSSGNPPSSNGVPPGLARLLNLLDSGRVIGTSPPAGGTFPPAGVELGSPVGTALHTQFGGLNATRSGSGVINAAVARSQPITARDVSENDSFTIEQTAGCACEQIIDAFGLGAGHEKFGCSLGAMRDWVDYVNGL